MTFSQFLKIMRARWRLALSIFAGVIMLTLSISLLLPENYKATATLVADLKPDALTGMSQMMSMQQTGFLSTQADIVSSIHVAQRVVRQLKLADSADSRQKWMRDTDGRGDYRVWLAELIGRNLIVKPSRDSNVLEISYKSVSAPFAAAMANSYAKAYIDTVVQMRVDPARGYAEFFEERALLARKKLEKAQARLAEAQRENRIITTDERLDAETTKLTELAGQVVRSRAALADAESRTSQSSKRADQMQDIISNPLVSSLKADLVRAQTKLKELSEKLGSEHPSVLEVQANIKETAQRLQNEIDRLRSSLHINSDMSRTRLQSAEAEYEEQRNLLLKLKSERSALSVLSTEVDQAQRIYEAIQSRQNQTNLESASAQSNIYLLSAATEPPQPSSPKVLLNTLIAFVPASMLMLLAVLLAESRDRRVRGKQDITQLLAVPIIGIMKAPSNEVPIGAARSLLRWMKKPTPSSSREFSDLAVVTQVAVPS